MHRINGNLQDVWPRVILLMAWIISCISKCASIYFNAHHVLYQDRINRHLWYMTYFVLWNVKRASLWPGLIQFKFFFFCHYGLSCESQVFSIAAISRRHRHYSLPPTPPPFLSHISLGFFVTFFHMSHFVNYLFVNCVTQELITIQCLLHSWFGLDPATFSLCHTCILYVNMWYQFI